MRAIDPDTNFAPAELSCYLLVNKPRVTSLITSHSGKVTLDRSNSAGCDDLRRGVAVDSDSGADDVESTQLALAGPPTVLDFGRMKDVCSAAFASGCLPSAAISDT